MRKLFLAVALLGAVFLAATSHPVSASAAPTPTIVAQAPTIVVGSGVYSNHIRPECRDGLTYVDPFVCDDGLCDEDGEACSAGLTTTSVIQRHRR